MRQLRLPRPAVPSGLRRDGQPASGDDPSAPPPRRREPVVLGRKKPSPEQIVTFGVVTAAVIFVFSQLQPSLIFANTTPAGGDMGAHVWGPAYMRDHLLPNFRLTGWGADWYAGFPAFFFYFPLPSLLIVVLDVVLPYGVAFKLVTILGLVGLPVAAWAFGRLMGMRFPGPALLGVAAVPFLFDRYFTIYGGNIPSTLAGEFSFAISLCLALVFLGLVGRGLDTGRHRAIAAVVLALTGLSHLLPTIFAVTGACVLLLLRPGRSRVKFLGAIFGVGAALAAFWSIPFFFGLPYINNMGWEKITEYSKNLFRWSNPNSLRLVLMLAVAGAITSVLFRRRTGLFLVGMATISATVFVMAPQGRLWNARVLPFWYLCLYLLAAVAVTEACLAIAQLFARDPHVPSMPLLRATPVVAALVVWVAVGLPLGVVPDWLPAPQTADSSYIPAWARWNYSGYERKDAFPEYDAVIKTMREVGNTNGCGRAHWEYESNLDRFGTPMALMLLPYWTDGCIGSMEGLYFESSATVPYHFLSAGELSKAPSNPQRDLPYRAMDVAAGVRHLQMLGSRYYMAFSDETVAQASQHPDLRLVATTGTFNTSQGPRTWRVYEVAGAELVTPLAFEPAVVTGYDKKGERPWLDFAVNWYMDPNAHDVFLAADGPSEWQRIGMQEVPSTTKTIGSGVSVDVPARRPTPGTGVTNIKSGDDSLSFDVDRPGSPVLVKVSYFPNWKVSGAEGPYRVTPNLMVVIPTEQTVEMRFGYRAADILGWLVAVAGVVAVVYFVRRGPVDLDGPDEPSPSPAGQERRDAGAHPGEADRPEPVSARDPGP
ncbi:MAG: 6-pyruvoyl-tetrahydropterin synthase-related protein [Acidimicrobiia bacterium]